MSRRAALLGAGAFGLSACGGGGGAPAFRVGHQKNGLLLLAKNSARLESALAAAAQVRWLEFSSGPPLLEAMRVGSLDFGSTGDTPPIFAQASGAAIVYVGAVRLSGQAGGVIVPAGSPVRALSDLRGKRLAFTRGSSAHNSAAALLEAAGLTFADVEEVNLAPADAATAFAQGGVDAWVIWDPYFTVAVKEQGARVLLPLSELPLSAAFFLARREFAETQPDILRAALRALVAEAAWADANRAEVAALFAEASGLPLPLLQDTVTRDDFAIEPMSPEIIANQQAIADRFVRLGLLPAPVRIADAVWTGWDGA